MGGIYAVHKLRAEGFTVVGIESAPEVGGVWYHNAYPGSRVDLESDTFCFFFDEGLYRDWTWSERYAAQPEVLAYLKHVADRFDVRRSIRFNTRVVGTTWLPGEGRWLVETDTGPSVKARFLVMATGQLARPRDLTFPGLEDFQGEWYRTSHWPQTAVDLVGKRVAIIGTGSSGVQAITEIAKYAGNLTVFQRSPHYSAPAQNRAPDEARTRRLKGRFPQLYGELLQTDAATFMPAPAGRAADFTEEGQQQLMQQRWDFGSQSMLGVFNDQMTDWDSNEIVAGFVRDKVRNVVQDTTLQASLIPSYPMGTKRLILDTGYYEVFSQPNVDFVDIRNDPIQRITRSGIQTRDRDMEFDVIIFAIGFEAFTGTLIEANIRNDVGLSPTDLWDRGPATYLGLQTHGFPNLFMLMAPGSTSVLANLYVGNTYQVDWLSGLFAHMKSKNLKQVQPSVKAQERWGVLQAAGAENLIRRQVENYMVKVNDDGSRVYLPWGGGLPSYVKHANMEAAGGYTGFEFA